MLSRRQAAIRGGGCHGHIRRAFQHLGADAGRAPNSAIGEDIWHAVLGGVADAVAEICRGAEAPGLLGCPA
eukprot:3160312-Lingulodinium_polyedra.AAC.1